MGLSRRVFNKAITPLTLCLTPWVHFKMNNVAAGARPT
jgi:hypothetical protein